MLPCFFLYHFLAHFHFPFFFYLSFTYLLAYTFQALVATIQKLILYQLHEFYSKLLHILQKLSNHPSSSTFFNKAQIPIPISIPFNTEKEGWEFSIQTVFNAIQYLQQLMKDIQLEKPLTHDSKDWIFLKDSDMINESKLNDKANHVSISKGSSSPSPSSSPSSGVSKESHVSQDSKSQQGNKLSINNSNDYHNKIRLRWSTPQPRRRQSRNHDNHPVTSKLTHRYIEDIME